MSEATAEDPATRSGILRAEFGDNWRWWRWLQRQFTATSIGVLGTVIAVCGGYIVHLRESVVQVRERVVVLETKVIPFVQDQARLEAIDTTLTDHAERLKRLEDNWDTATAQASTAPSVKRRR